MRKSNIKHIPFIFHFFIIISFFAKKIEKLFKSFNSFILQINIYEKDEIIGLQDYNNIINIYID